MTAKKKQIQSLMNNLDWEHIHENVLLLRRRLMLSQGEFIDKYLSVEHKPLLSVSKLSNFEKKGGKDSEEIARFIAENISIDEKIFLLPPDNFAKNLDMFLESRLSQGKEFNDIAQLVKKKSYVNILVNVISDYLMDSVISGELKPGDKLPSDRNLSLMFNVGRTSIREALKVLSVLGLINILPGQGTFIASGSTEFFLSPLSWTFLVGERNEKHVVEVRNIIEMESAKLAAENATAENLANLKDIFDQTTEAFNETDLKRFLDLDIDFHLAVAKCSHNPIIENLLLTSRKLIKHISKSGMVSLEDISSIYQEHVNIYHNIVSHNAADAVASMSDHLKSAQKRYRFNK